MIELYIVIYYWDKTEGLELEDHNRLIEIHCEIIEEGFNLEDDLKAWLKEQDLESYYNRIKSM